MTSRVVGFCALITLCCALVACGSSSSKRIENGDLPQLSSPLGEPIVLVAPGESVAESPPPFRASDVPAPPEFGPTTAIRNGSAHYTTPANPVSLFGSAAWDNDGLQVTAGPLAIAGAIYRQTLNPDAVIDELVTNIKNATGGSLWFGIYEPKLQRWGHFSQIDPNAAEIPMAQSVEGLLNDQGEFYFVLLAYDGFSGEFDQASLQCSTAVQPLWEKLIEEPGVDLSAEACCIAEDNSIFACLGHPGFSNSLVIARTAGNGMLLASRLLTVEPANTEPDECWWPVLTAARNGGVFLHFRIRRTGEVNWHRAVCKLDADLNLLWAKDIDLWNGMDFNDVCARNDGGILLCAVELGSQTTPRICALDAMGEVEFSHTILAPGGMLPSSVQENTDASSYFVTGSYDFAATPKCSPLALKCSNSEVLEWARSWAGNDYLVDGGTLRGQALQVAYCLNPFATADQPLKSWILKLEQDGHASLCRTIEIPAWRQRTTTLDNEWYFSANRLRLGPHGLYIFKPSNVGTAIIPLDSSGLYPTIAVQAPAALPGPLASQEDTFIQLSPYAYSYLTTSEVIRQNVPLPVLEDVSVNVEEHELVVTDIAVDCSRDDALQVTDDSTPYRLHLARYPLP